MRTVRVGALAALLVCGPLACGEEPAPVEEVVRPVKLLTLGSAAASRKLEYPGTISATQQSEMGFEVPGKVIEFPVREGQQVAKSELLARLDPRDYQAALDSALAYMRAAKTEYDRNKILFEKDIVARSELEKKQRNYEVTEAGVREAEKALDDTYLRANFAGAVARRLVNDFQNVKAKEAVLILQDTSILEIDVNIPERDMTLGRRERRSAEEATLAFSPVVSLTAVPDRDFPARVKEVATTADEVTRTFKATLAFDPPDDVAILPGMTAKVTLTLASTGRATRGFTIPSNAVVADADGGAYVWRVDPSSMRVERTAISVGPLAGTEVDVTSGLSSGDTIATSGVHHLREGMQVRAFGN